ncbi:MAG: hypothetical protein HKN68_00205 [Saprospiraceae bacterium]|nr:hypothetical protein [Saprospiraceae bacterium]
MNSKNCNENSSRLQQITSIPGLISKRIIKIENFLPQQERDTLFNAVCTNQETFRNRGIPESAMRGSLYLDLGSEESEDSKVLPISKACECLSKRIMMLLPELFTTLDVKPFPVSNIPLNFINGLDGHMGLPHTDESGGRFKISLLYYLNKVPKAFQGGALEFYETNARSQSGHSEKAFAKIEHKDNLLIAFLSHMYHGVSEVQLDSDKFEDGRFVIVGFLGPW